ncbi:MAG: hypothetical protein JXM70_17920 [Pirellulales bacterium]|nr:hypothetical protein [Pirellulales bacterium]
MNKRLLIIGLTCSAIISQTAAAAPSESQKLKFKLKTEFVLKPFGGIPFCVDLNDDGQTEVLWLQSAGMFQSKVFDKSISKRADRTERDHFCLTASDASGNVLWQIGKPWQGKRPFLTHGGERNIDCADIDADGIKEVVCIRGDELLVINAKTGQVKRSVKLKADNAQIVVLGHTGPKPTDWTIMVKNPESSYKPHEYANPAWFYDNDLRFLKTADHHGSGHVPLALDTDSDGLDEFIIGYSLVDNDLRTVWTYHPTSADKWSSGEMHVDDHAVARFGGRLCIAYAASNLSILLDAKDGSLIWRREGVHPQHCQVGHFVPGDRNNAVFIRNKRSNNQLFDAHGKQLWKVDPPVNFPHGRPAACERAFHVFDPTTLLPGAGPQKTDLLIYSDGGWPYAIDGYGKRYAEFPHTPNSKQDWGKVPGRPDDYGYGYYVRVADFDGDGENEVLINDRRFAWIYETLE